MREKEKWLGWKGCWRWIKAWGFPAGSDSTESTCNAGDLGSIPESGRMIPRRKKCYTLQCSCLENSMDRGSWWATVHEVAESDTTEWLTFMQTTKNKRQKSLHHGVGIDIQRPKAGWCRESQQGFLLCLLPPKKWIPPRQLAFCFMILQQRF